MCASTSAIRPMPNIINIYFENGCVFNFIYPDFGCTLQNETPHVQKILLKTKLRRLNEFTSTKIRCQYDQVWWDLSPSQQICEKTHQYIAIQHCAIIELQKINLTLPFHILEVMF